MVASNLIDKLVPRLAAAVRNDDLEEFCTQVQEGVAFFDSETIADLIDRQLPLELDVAFIPRMLMFVEGEVNYIDTARSLLGELTQFLVYGGFTSKIDFCRDEDEGVPDLMMTHDTALMAGSIYEPHEWKKCLPFLIFCGKFIDTPTTQF